MGDSPTVSVLTPVYNGAAFLKPMIESILSQTWRDFELLIIDDGSTDASLSILQHYANQDTRIRLESRENRGVTATFNELLNMARGEFVAQADNDDISLPDRLALQVNYLQQHPEVVCLSGAYHLIDYQGHFLTTLYSPETDADIQARLLQGHSSICHACAMSRREAVIQVGGWDESLHFACDFDLWLRLGEVGQLANLRQPLVKYRLHQKSNSASHVRQQRLEGRHATEQAWERRGISNGRYEATALWRPGPDRDSQHHFMLKYGWWAFNSGQRQTALHYGTRAIRQKPWAAAGWKLLTAAATKSLPPRMDPEW